MALISLMPIDRPLRLILIPLSIILVIAIAFKVGSLPCLEAAVHNAAKLAAALRRISLTLKVAGVLVVLLLALYGLTGALTVPFGVDELSYHAPQAIGVFQDGRVRSFDSQVPWLLFFPQGAANVWAWTMFFTGDTVLFRAVQLVFGVQLLLAMWLLARRTGASETAAALAVLITSTSALFFIVVTTCNDDIGNAASIVTMLAFFAPSQDGRTSKRTWDLVAACLALAEACLIKIPFVAGFFAFAGFAGFVWARFDAFDRWRQIKAISRIPVLWVACLVLVFSCYTYVLNALETGNPIYPISIDIGGHHVLTGTMLPKNFGPGTDPFAKAMSLPARWTEVFSEWFIPITVDSLGTAGPVFLMVVLFFGFVAGLDGIGKRDRWTIVLAALAASMFIVPEAWLPRYGLPWLSVWIVLASLSFTASTTAMPSVSWAIVMVVSVSIIPQLQSIDDTYLWLRSNSSVWYKDRGRSVPEHYDLDRSLAPSAGLVRMIRKSIGKDAVLEWCVNAYPYLLWNTAYSNRIHYLNGCTPCPPCGSADRSDTDIDQTTESAQSDWLILYSSSALARRLNQHPALHYSPTYTDPTTGSNADRFNMTLFRHISSSSQF